MTTNNKVLVLGSGGREHAIVWKLSQSSLVTDIYVHPGSYAIGNVAKAQIVNEIDLKDFDGIGHWCKVNQIKLVVVGPEDPLASGIADVLKKFGILCFGPSKAGARIEWDKSWAKDFMRAWTIPTAKYQSFTDVNSAKEFIMNAPFEALVVKASGLAAGKGVVVAASKEEACQAVDEILGDGKFGCAGETIVIEEKLSGEEVSLLAFVDGENVKVMLPAQDHKRLLDGDLGPNTGGMGAYCPCPMIDSTNLEFAVREILERSVAGFRSSNIDYCGVLYAGIMLTPSGPKTLEFNCRFGDPETQVLLPLMESDLFEVMVACCERRLSQIDIKWRNDVAAVGVIMASKGYPETSTKGCEISNLQVNSPDHLIFHSGTAFNNGVYSTNGGRVLINVALSPELQSAAHAATKYCEKIHFSGAQYRSDIAHKAFKYIELTYKDSGVDIVAGNDLVKQITPMAKKTNRPGVVGGLGGFGGLFRLNEVTYKNANGEDVPYTDPLLVESISGIGTKLKLAIKYQKYETVGIDLVAQSVNSVLSYGAQPIAFLDYFACGKLDVSMAANIVNGIANGCIKANCALLGGETAEMPALFGKDSYDLAGYCLGIAEYGMELKSREGDILLGLPANGFHCNGYDLLHEAMTNLNESYDTIAPFSETQSTFVEEFFKPSEIYVPILLPWIYKKYVQKIAKVGSGGLFRGIEKLLENGLAAELDATKWKIPPVYGWLYDKANMSPSTILRNFNLGIGMLVVVSRSVWENNKFDGAIEIGKVLLGLIIDSIPYWCPLTGHVTRQGSKKQKIYVANLQSTLSTLSGNVGRAAEMESVEEIEEPENSQNSFMRFVHSEAVKTFTPNVIPVDHSHRKRVFHLKKTQYVDPILVIGTDGIGSKIEVGKKIKKLNTIGIDLVAMCVNDILCNGAEPLTFLDYYASHKVDKQVSYDIFSGVIDGVTLGECSLVGGHTIEVPDIYEKSEFDMAGFALGIVDSVDILPKTSEIEIGDVVIGLPSDGVHSNGFSMVHKLMHVTGHSFEDAASFSACGKCYGGGLLENIPRILPAHYAVELDFTQINIPPIFAWLTAKGNVSHEEMQRTFNCGIGLVLVVSPANKDFVVESLLEHRGDVIGSITERLNEEPQVRINALQFSENLARVQRLLSQPLKRVAVLISGTGSNLQSLIDATRNSTMGIRAEIVFVLSNKENVMGLERASNAGIDNKFLSHKAFKSREQFDAAITSLLESYRVDIVCLAGFMRILSSEFVKKWKGRLINIHPSLLPKFPGLHVQRRALEAGEKRSGCTVHFVDEGVDTGAIIYQRSVAIVDGETEESLTKKIHRAEHFSYPVALRMLVNGETYSI
ncbi:Trifunctional purine biosynthetic protein adenosine-3 [Pseudolycoriella hygida]|uniref:Trifunctional purine biosynthetic protein adenosine-3 n=1 Tax=Pseudolycoriella hygida TaxID=35572 RepID=A0A9Q0NHH9_9DIPT|nr:Trifunctional purine biosynthetic protein adenosine-3 [Pseudolycoriella hygida]